MWTLIPRLAALTWRTRLLACSTVVSTALGQGIVQLTVNSNGEPGNGDSSHIRLSADGHWAVFNSVATNLAPGGGGAHDDIFLRDVWHSTTELLSLGLAGQPSNGGSELAQISYDGRFVVFLSEASNLVPGDTNGMRDVFVLDRATGTMERANVSSTGVQANWTAYLKLAQAISADGRFVVFHSHAINLVPGDANGRLDDVFLRDRLAATTTIVSVSTGGVQSNGSSFSGAVSSDGRCAVFESRGWNLVPGDTNGLMDLFVRDIWAGTTERINVSTAGEEANAECYEASISSDGRYVAFASHATNLVPGDTNGARDVFLRDRLLGETRRISVSTCGEQGDGFSNQPMISPDARFVSFTSIASNFAPGDVGGLEDVFLRDLRSGATLRVSIGLAGQDPNDWCDVSSLSGDGRFVTFWTWASNVVAGDNLGFGDSFLLDRGPARIANYCATQSNSLGCASRIAATGQPSITSGSPFVVSVSEVLNGKHGSFFYGRSPSFTPFHGGTSCVAPPAVRTPVQSSGGSPPPDDCSGVLSLDFNALLRAGTPLGLVVGDEVFGQFWYRDPLSPGFVTLTDALQFTIQL